MTDTNSITQCSIEGCERPGPFKRGWCGKHYMRWRRHGDPLAGKWEHARTIREAFDTRTEWDENGCLVWTGARTTQGYGEQWFRNQMWYTHRLAWTLVNGEIPEGMEINHLCWNTLCVNVDHLNPATRSQNATYMNGPPRNNTSGYRNVMWDKRRQCWFVKAMKDGKQYLKYGFATPEEASAYAEKLREELMGEFAGKG